MTRRILILLLPFLCATAFEAVAQSGEADLVTGTWLVEKKNARVKIYEKNGKYFGKIVWLEEPNDENGKPKVDKENPEESLRSRPLLGLIMLRDFEYDEDLEWDDGEIYDPKNGKTYSCKMTLKDNGKTLDVRGYIGFSFIGRSQTWTRVE